MNFSDTQSWSDEETNRVPIKIRKVIKRHADDDEEQRIKKAENDNLFRQPQDFQGHVIFFLKKPMIYVFKHAVFLQKTKYNYRVHKIHENDIIALDTILEKMKAGVRVIGNDAYMNGKTTEFKNKEYSEEKIEFNSALRWKIIIDIQGYKSSNSNRLSPIWKIIQAFETI